MITASLASDLRLALRGFRRAPTFVVAVVTVLALGIGATTATFTVLRAALLRPLPVAGQERLAVLWPYQVAGSELAPSVATIPPLAAASRTMRAVAGVTHFGTWNSPYLDGDRTTVLATTPVTANYFEVLGARPALGRLLRADDDAPGKPTAAVLGYRTWRRQFGGAPSVLGRRLVDPYSRRPLTIVGVAAPGLDYPRGVDLWTTIARGAEPRVLAVVRLAPGASVEAARGEYLALMRRLDPQSHYAGATATPFDEAARGDATPVLVVLGAAVALLLLIACVNVGSLSLVRARGRARELAVRRALGASRGAVVRQLLVESALLAAAGGALGLACGAALVRALVAASPTQLPRLDGLRLDGALAAVAFAVTSLCLALVALAPALASARVSPASPLRGDGRAGGGTRRGRRVRDALVATQVALALVLLAGAGLLVRSLRRLEGLDLAYRAEHLSIVSLATDDTKYTTQAQWDRLGGRVEQRLGAVPGVIATTPLVTRPFDGAAINLGRFEAEGEEDAGAAPPLPWEGAGPDYFRTLDMPLVRGRAFTVADRPGAEPVAIVSESVARRLWPGCAPAGGCDVVGRRLRLAPSQFKSTDGIPASYFAWRTVVGVAPDNRLRELRTPSPTVYIPWGQTGWPNSLLAVRSRGDDAGLARALRAALHDVDPALVVWEVTSTDAILRRSLAAPRLNALLLATFGVAALLLAAVGLFGVVAAAVREQTREIGVRVALGATAARVRGAVLRHALVVAGAGAGAGLVAALATTRVLRSLLFEVGPTDPAALGGACAVLFAVVLGAAFLPARAATRVDPARTLRGE